MLYLLPLGLFLLYKYASTSSLPPWLLIAQKEIGVKEVEGSGNNSRVIEYHSTAGGYTSDAVHWCSSFVNWVMKNANLPYTRSSSSQSWNTYGKGISSPCLGAIAVFHYGSGKGHVGFVVGQRGEKLAILGGNQSNEVKISIIPKNYLVGYRLPSGYTPSSESFKLPSL